MTYRHENTDTSELVAHLKELTTALTAVHGDLYWLAMQTPKAQEDPDQSTHTWSGEDAANRSATTSGYRSGSFLCAPR